MMRRRRRRTNQIAFGLDSFLDVITNVIGIIIRMIIVVWVGAQAYHAAQIKAEFDRSESQQVQSHSVADPLESELAQHRQELQRAKLALINQLKLLPEWAKKNATLQSEFLSTVQQREKLERDVLASNRSERVTGEGKRLLLSELRQRGEKLKKEVEVLSRKPIPRKKLFYRAPVSRQVRSEELHFECKYDRVSFVDLGTFVEEAKDAIRENVETLRKTGMLKGTTRQTGAFRMRFDVKRIGSSLGKFLGDSGIDFIFKVEPMALKRGESLSVSLNPKSDFRQVVDFASPRQTVITLWVYPDSFSLYRGLRDYLRQLGFEVACRPMPRFAPIGLSPHGSASRGQ